MRNRYENFNSGRANFFLVAIITVILFGAVLKVTSSVVVPFVVALLLAIVFAPIIKFLGKFHIQRIISVLLILLLFFGLLAFIMMILYSSGRAILTLYPKYEARLTEIYIWVSRFFELPYDEHLSFFDNIWGQVGIRSRVRLLTLSFSNTFFAFLRDAFLTAIFMVFLLLEASFIREKLDNAFESPRALQIINISSDIMNQVTRYLSIKFMMSLLNAILTGITLKIIGIEFAIVWAVFQFVTNFIPNIGTIVMVLSATAFSLLQFWPDPMPIIATGVILSITNGLIGFVMEPKIMGDRLGLSPLVVIVSLLIWGWLWGLIGLIIAVPMTAIIKIVCKSIPVLEPISILLGSRRAVIAVKHEDDEEAMIRVYAAQRENTEAPEEN